jgi:hypothetical protein
MREGHGMKTILQLLVFAVAAFLLAFAVATVE